MRSCLKIGYLFESSLKIFNPYIANRNELGEFGCFWIFSEISDNVLIKQMRWEIGKGESCK